MFNSRPLHDLSPHAIAELVVQARDLIVAKRLLQPHIAIVLGSGLGDLAARVAHASAIKYSDIPGFRGTSASGHAGQLVLGFLAGLPIVLMQGRSHRYEGYSNREVAFPIEVMHALGASTLITTNAAGGLNPRFQTGDLMAIDSHLDFLWNRRQIEQSSQVSVRGDSPYNHAMIQRAKRTARLADITLHQGCYLSTLGPTYETRSEYRMFRWTGADAVGMSTVPEVLMAQRLRMKTLAFSVITNVASTDIPTSTTHTEVVDSGKLAGPKLMHIIEQLLEDFAGQPD